MLEWGNPYGFLLVLLPLAMRWLPDWKTTLDAVQAPYFQRLQQLSGQPLSDGAAVVTKDFAQRALLLVIWLCLAVASAQPQWLSTPINETRSARDLMVAVDLSGSMAGTDFSHSSATGAENIDRLSAVKLVLEQLVKSRQHDRLGLIVFGDSAYLQTPFTEDHHTWLTLLRETAIGLAGQGTMLGDAIGLAIKLFEESSVKNRVLILLTDGNDTGSRVPPVDAAKVAAGCDITIYTIAIGDPESIGGDALDTDTLKRVAELTGGAFYQAIDPEQLAAIQSEISRLEPDSFETLRFQPRQNLHYLPVALAACLSLLFACWRGLNLSRNQQSGQSNG